jgi:predicted acylesterase/phospholipase RssA
VLGGGGARGFAHIGAIRALEEAGLYTDMIGGSSMGALIGAIFATGQSCAEMADLARKFSSRRQLMDFTLPMASLLASYKVTKVYKALFDNIRIEDLWRPFFCVSSNLTRAQPVVHRSGLLWEAIRASTSITGVFAPMLKDGDVLVDGGVMNSFPVDILRSAFAARTVIGINATPPKEQMKPYEFGSSISGWQVLWSRVNPFMESRRVPTIFGNLMRATEVNSVYHMGEAQRLADFFIQLPVGQYATLDFPAYEEIIEIGYRATRESIRAWREGKPQGPA